jgi:arginine N-succinyltransferase
MPKHPIYIPLLPEDAQTVIGQVHENTKPALTVLEKEGFEFRDLVDIFDGGPTLHCNISDIRAIKASVAGTVVAIEKDVADGQQQLISNAKMDFRTCLGDTKWSDDTVTIEQVTALRLGLRVGDRVRCVSLKPG